MDKTFYKERIMELINNTDNLEFLELIYRFVRKLLGQVSNLVLF